VAFVARRPAGGGRRLMLAAFNWPAKKTFSRHSAWKKFFIFYFTK